jgi:hypothetical protein
VKETESSKPPGGVISYSVELGNLQALADATERIDTLMLGSAQVEVESGEFNDLLALDKCEDSDDEDDLYQLPGTENLVATQVEPSDFADSDWEDTPGFHLGLMGDPLARRAEHVLRQGCPFPGDDQDDPDIRDRERFHVYRT